MSSSLPAPENTHGEHPNHPEYHQPPDGLSWHGVWHDHGMQNLDWAGAGTAPPPAPPRRAPRIEPAQRPRATPAMLCAALAVGGLTNLAVRTGITSLVGVVAVMAAAAVLWHTSDRTTSQRVLLALALAVAPWLMLRASPFMAVANLCAVSALLATSAVLARSGRLSDISIPRIITESPKWLGLACSAPWFLARTVRHDVLVRGRGARFRSASRGLVMMVPTVLILGALLAAGDAVFAQLLADLPSAGPVSGHALSSMALAVPMGAALVLSSKTTPVAPEAGRARPLGSAEAVVVLTGLVVLYGAFTAVQVATAFGGADAVLESAGLTRAEHARQGFFGLLWAAGLTLAVLVALQLATGFEGRAARRRFTGLAVLAIALTEVIVVGAVQRLVAYADIFGWTVLRLASTGLAVWIGLVFLLLGLEVVQGDRGRRWFPAGIVLVSVAMLIAANLVNHERFIVNHNIDHATAEMPADIDYLQRLSPDGRAQLLRRVPDLPAEQQRQVAAQQCGTASTNRSAADGLGFNRANASYADLLRAFCGDS